MRILFVLVLSSLFVTGTAAPRDDYLALNSNADVAAKLSILQSWVAELQARGNEVPPTLLSAVNTSINVSQNLDGYANELMVREDAPSSLGEVSISGGNRLMVGQQVNLTLIYRAGQSLTPGMGLLLTRHWQHGVFLQFRNPRQPNFVKVTSSNRSVTLALTTAPFTGIHANLTGSIELPFVEVQEGALQQGDEIRIEFPNLSLPTMATDEFEMPVYLRREDGHYYYVKATRLSVEAGRPAHAFVKAPSLLSVGESFDLSMRAEDEFGNLAKGRFPSVDVIKDGVFNQRLPDSEEMVRKVAAINFTSPGLHYIEVRSGGGGFKGMSNPILVEPRANNRIAWVNLHQRTTSSTDLLSGSDTEARLNGLYDLLVVTDRDDLAGSDQPDREVSQSLEAGGNLVRAAGVMIAVPEITTDTRLHNVHLAEVQAGAGTHEWLLNHFASGRSRVGVVASAGSYQSREMRDRPVTGVWYGPGESVFDALLAGKTFATSGSRGFVRMQVNGGDTGSRVSASARRVIEGEVVAGEPIANIELFRNGKLLDAHRFQRTEDLTLKVSVQSDSTPIVPGYDYPRNAREWLGYLTVQGANIRALNSPGYARKEGAAIAENPAVPGRVDFYTWTHGNRSSFYLTLAANEDADVSLEVNVSEGFEDVAYLTRARAPSVTPGFRQVISLDEIGDEGYVRNIAVHGYSDEMRIELSSLQRPTRQAFSFVDIADELPGDYYHIRATMIDDHVIWSSPVYIGGFDAQKD